MRTTAAKVLTGIVTLGATLASGAAAFAEEVVATVETAGEALETHATDATALVAEHAPAAAEHGGNVGFPQLDASTYPSQLFWLAVAFILLYGLMSRVALPRVGAALDKRHAARSANLDAAEDMNNEAQVLQAAHAAALAKAHDGARDAMVRAAQETADKVTAEGSRFGEEARTRIAAAEKKIGAARDAAMKDIADIAADIAADMAGKIAGVKVAKAEAQQAVAAVSGKG